MEGTKDALRMRGSKGSTINDLGGPGGKFENIFIFSTGMPFENYFWGTC